MELKDLLALTWKRRWVVISVLVLTVGLSVAFAETKAKTYESTAVIALTPDVSKGQGFVGTDNLSALLRTYAESAKSTVNLRGAERILGRPLPGKIESSTESGTGILRISARAATPTDAAASASAAASAFQETIANNRLLVATLVNPAEPVATPVQPRPPIIIAVGFVLGLLGGIALAVGIERLRRRVETAADIGEHTTAPVVGRLPRSRALGRRDSGLVWDNHETIGLQESYRALRTNLEFLLDHRAAGRVLEITSPDPGQGKSTVAANLAVAFAGIGIETILLDADLRRPRQHEIFGLDNRSGLSTALASGEAPRAIATSFPNLWVVPSGPLPPDPTEMLHIRLGAVIRDLRCLNALVVVDTPPLLPVSDARLVAPHADGVLLLVAAGSQKPAHLAGAIERLNLVDAKPMGVIINKAGSESHAADGYYGYQPAVNHLAPPAGAPDEAPFGAPPLEMR